jgi:hypothetical protein
MVHSGLTEWTELSEEPSLGEVFRISGSTIYGRSGKSAGDERCQPERPSGDTIGMMLRYRNSARSTRR